MTRLSAISEFTVTCNLQLQRKSGLTGRSAAKAGTGQWPEWAVSVSQQPVPPRRRVFRCRVPAEQ